MIVTEYELRANWHKTKAQRIELPPGSVITPSARDFLRSKGIEVQIEGNGLQDLHKTPLSNAQQSVSPSPSSSPSPSKSSEGTKPEHMTHLRAGCLVNKTHPIVAYRGQLDLFQCELIEAQGFFAEKGEDGLIQTLEEIAAFARQLMVSEVKETPFQWETLIGLSPEELRERSHHPKKYFGVEHTPLSYTHGSLVAKLHHLRAKSREVELYANRAFTDETGACTRSDLIQALNRLSSVFYILACEIRGRIQQKQVQKQAESQVAKPVQTGKAEKDDHGENVEKTIPIGTSNRHIHLSEKDLKALFGETYPLTLQKPLSQPGQFAAHETVTLVGPKGRIEHVRILGPVRKSTQAELSVTDCYKLGIKPVIRDSGQHEGTPGLQIVGPQGSVRLESGVLVARRHIHLHTRDAEEWSLKDGDRVSVKLQSQRPLILEDVLIRVSDQYHKEMHLDLDEANAALIDAQSQGVLMEV